MTLRPLALAIAIALTGCGSEHGDHEHSDHDHDHESDEHGHDDHDHESDEHGHEDDHHADHESEAHGHDDHGDHAEASASLALNNGEKWALDDHSRSVFQRMHETAGADAESMDAANAVGATLKTQVGELISGCTMDGPAHDNLHIFLGQYMPAVNALADDSETEAVQADLARVRELLAEQERFFE